MNAPESRTSRLAVLPAEEGAAGDGEESYFCRGFILDLITELARFAEIEVLSSQTSLSPRLKGKGDAELSKELGVDLILRLGVRKRSESIRINAQLVDLASGSLLWAERYDAGLDRWFEIQDNLVEKISACLPRHIRTAKLEKSRRKSNAELEAYDLWLQGMDRLRKGNVEGDEEARELFDRALEKDPHFARAFQGLSISHFNEWSCQNWELSELSECRAFQYAQRAYELDPNDAQTHIVLARVYLFRRKYECAENHLKRALELNPNDADGLVMVASMQAFLGETDSASETYERAVRLNPFFDPWYFAYGGFIKVMQSKFSAGIEMALKAPLTSVWLDLSAFLAIAYAYEGNLKEAGIYRDIFLSEFERKILFGRKAKPGEASDWLQEVNCFRRDEDAELYRKGLELAGFETGEARKEEGDCVDGKKAPEPANEGEAAVFQLNNELRRIGLGGQSILLPEVKGFRDIEVLLERQGAEIHCTELMGSVSEDGEAVEIMDARARQDCARSIRELQSELLEAEQDHDTGRAEKIREELDPLLDHLAKAVGIGGRSRRLAAPAERARSAVTWRIRSAIKKIESGSPDIGRHFANSIRTGTFCSYSPEKPLAWKI